MMQNPLPLAECEIETPHRVCEWSGECDKSVSVVKWECVVVAGHSTTVSCHGDGSDNPILLVRL